MNPTKVKSSRIKRLKGLLSKKQSSQALPGISIDNNLDNNDPIGSDSSFGLLPQLKRLIKRPRITDLPDKKEDEGSDGSEGSSGSGSGGGSGRSGSTDSGGRKPTFLGEETALMDRKRREIEQGGHRQLAKVHAREHNLEETQSQTPEGELQNDMLQHPWLDGQRFDGIDPNVNPEPPLNTDARREFDNERREQEMEKQLRLGNMPKFSSAPKPGQQ